jgi:hypothetical protein
MDLPHLLTFEPWTDPDVDQHGELPDGTYSRLAWLPTIGPSSWLIWTTIAGQLRRDPKVTWQCAALAGAHGLGQGTGRTSALARTLDRLARYRLLVPGEPTWLMRASAPPVSDGNLRRLPAFVQAVHLDTWRTCERRAG